MNDARKAFPVEKSFSPGLCSSQTDTPLSRDLLYLGLDEIRIHLFHQHCTPKKLQLLLILMSFSTNLISLFI